MQWTRPVSRLPEVARPDGRAAVEAPSAVPEPACDGQTPTEQGQPKPDDAKRQAVLDAQYQTFLKFTYRETDTGDPDVVALKAHARHAGSDKWRLASTFTDRQTLIDYLYREDPVNAKAVVPSKWPPTTAPK